jgi:hypothetical protein
MLYTEQFLRTELANILESQGSEIPKPCKEYIVTILADKIDKNPWQPIPSYAEAYMTTTTTPALLKLAETCWYTRAVFPELGKHRGINPSYYVQLGQGCYGRVLAKVNNETIVQMIKYFEPLADITLAAIRQQELVCLKL